MVSFTWNDQWFWGTVYYTFLHFVIIHCKLKEFWVFLYYNVMLFLPGGIVSYINPPSPPQKKTADLDTGTVLGMFSTILSIWRKNRTLLNLESMLHCLNFVDKDWLINSKLSQGFFQLKVYNFNGCVLRKILGSPMLCIWVTQDPQLMISTQKLRFPSHPRAKVWHQGPTGAEHYAPINVNPAGAGGRQGMGGDLTFFKNLQSNSQPTGNSFQSNATKFAHPGLHIAVKYPKAEPKKGTIRISPNKTLQSLFILRCCTTKDTCSSYSCNYRF